MKNVLVISFDFNQNDSIGSVRAQGLVKYLPACGWNPVVLTIKTSAPLDKNYTIFETPYTDTIVVWKKRLGLPVNKTVKEHCNFPAYKEKNTVIDILIKFWVEIFTYPDPTISWSKSAIEKGDELLQERHFDAIISLMKPPTAHIIAQELVKRHHLVWIADFRDLWTQNHYYEYSGIRRFFERRLEHSTLSLVTALTTTSGPLAEKLKELHKNKKIFTITNGFDPDQINPHTPLTKKFSITYTGYIYKGRQDPEPLFRVLKALIDENRIDTAEIDVHFFGSHEDWLTDDCKKYHLEKVVKIHGQISREESIQKQRESQILLLLTWNDPREKGVYTAKVFDYLAARRPILAVGIPGSVITDLLSTTDAGVQVSSDEEIKDRILTLYREYKETGCVGYTGILSEIDTYSHKEMAKKFSDVLNTLCAPGGNFNP